VLPCQRRAAQSEARKPGALAAAQNIKNKSLEIDIFSTVFFTFVHHLLNLIFNGKFSN
jgi:hypothetical protein